MVRSFRSMRGRSCLDIRLPGVFLALGTLVFPALTMAATPLPLTPGAVQDTVSQPRAPALSSPAQVLFPPAEIPPQGLPDARRFLVSGFDFEGNTIISDALLYRLTERYLDLELTLAELDAIAAHITAFYRSRGYTVAQAFVPAQEVKDGLVRIQIIEGRLAAVSFNGQQHYRDAFLQGYLDRFATGEQAEIVTDASLERRLLLLNDLPGLTARATLSPGDAFGTTRMDVGVTEKLVDAFLGYSNSGNREVGEYRVDGGASLNNPLTLGDQLTLRAIRSTDGLFRYGQAGYSLPLGSDGLRLALSATRTNYRLAGDFKALDLSGKVRTRDATLSYPFIRSRSRNLIGALQYRRTSTRQYVLGSPLASSSIPMVVASLYANWIGRDSSITTLNVSYSSNSWHGGHGVATERVHSKYDGDVTYLTGATRQWDFFFHGRGVFANSRVPDIEKFALGGADSVRGFPNAYIRGDSGYLLTVEMRRQWRLASIPGYFSIFGDMGGVNNRGYYGTDRINSIGVGANAFIGNYGQIRAAYAKPVYDSVGYGDKHGRLWFNLTMTY